ncbi:FUN14 family protein [Penicillium riverlandense]|uniref:FUN14 family protein n=1 Tax=Penicillium riverlandense TaxID=1903569 RepID=UPI00254951C8|nr:FUN14 family protein [Penicillium riverlandense]KAJ5833508.1 FUN14 family protein [Penicillium riverlandense]
MPLPSIARLGLGLTIGLSAATTLHLHPYSPFRAAPMQCQYTAPYSRPDTQTNPDNGWAVHANDPILQKQGTTQTTSRSSIFAGFLSAQTMRQWAASKGYNILPINRMQKYVKKVDLRRAMSEHRPFKMSFGTVMALAAFAQF